MKEFIRELGMCLHVIGLWGLPIATVGALWTGDWVLVATAAVFLIVGSILASIRK